MYILTLTLLCLIVSPAVRSEATDSGSDSVSVSAQTESVDDSNRRDSDSNEPPNRHDSHSNLNQLLDQVVNCPP